MTRKNFTGRNPEECSGECFFWEFIFILEGSGVFCVIVLCFVHNRLNAMTQTGTVTREQVVEQVDGIINSASI